jgi:hypothetical protein
MMLGRSWRWRNGSGARTHGFGASMLCVAPSQERVADMGSRPLAGE